MSAPTPQTDAVEERNGNVLCSSANLEFARTLERELARQHETSLMLLHEIWEREEGFTETRKRLSALETALTAERGKVRALRAACESIEEQWDKNHSANPFHAGNVMQSHAMLALAATEDAT